MQPDKNDMKIGKSVSMHSLAFEGPCKCQIVTDPKSRNASHIAEAKKKNWEIKIYVRTLILVIEFNGIW